MRVRVSESTPDAPEREGSVDADRCYGCGGDVAAVLVGHGSVLCHDCRDEVAAAGRAVLDGSDSNRLL